MAPSLDEIRRIFAGEEQPSEPIAVQPTSSALKSAVDLSMPLRLLLGPDVSNAESLLAHRCPACNIDTAPEVLGKRHGGTHQRCAGCKFEFTARKVYAPPQLIAISKSAAKYAEAFRQLAARKEKVLSFPVVNHGKFSIFHDKGEAVDALLHFGEFKGKLVSEMARDVSRGRGYLRWMVSAEFPVELIDVVKKELAK